MDATVSARRDVKVMGLVGAAHSLSHFYQLALPPLFPFIKDEFGVGYAELGLLATLFYATSGVAQTPAGFLVDRFGARNVLFVGLGLLAAATAAYGVAPGFWALVPLVMLAGLGNSVFHPADYSILTASVSQPRLGRAYGAHTIGGNLGWAAAPVSALALEALVGWRGALILLGLGGLIALAFIAQGRDLLRYEAAKRSGATEALLPLISRPVLLCFGYFLLLAVALIAVQTFLPPLLEQLHGTPLELASVALTAFLLGNSAGILAGSVLADRTARHDAVVACGLGAGALMLLVVAEAPLHDGGLIAAIALAGVMIGVTTPSRDMLVRSAAPRGATGRVFGFVYSGLDAGSSLAPLAVGLMLDHGRADLVFWAVAVSLALAIFTALSLKRASPAAAVAAE
jgi:MFS family permease